MTDTTARLGLSLLAASQAQKHVTVNGDLVQLDCFIGLYFLGNGDNAPPGSPSDGDTYLIGSSPTGDWTGYASKIGYSIDGGWEFFTPIKGLCAYDYANSKFLMYDGAAWKDFGAVSAPAYSRTAATTVAGLVSAATAGVGARAFVTDANATTFASTVAGGGANKVPVYSDGTNWKIG